MVFYSISASAKGQQDSQLTRLASTSSENLTTVVFIGDSLTAGYGVKKEEAFPSRVEKILSQRGYKLRVINGGISGSVSAEADRRVRWFLKSKPQIIFLALGANDALKGTPPDVIKKNLAKAIDEAQANNITVLLAGIRVFANFGSEYNQKLENLYKELSREKKVALLPFLLEGVAMKRDLNLEDGKHPNAEGHAVIADHVADALEKLLKSRSK